MKRDKWADIGAAIAIIIITCLIAYGELRAESYCWYFDEGFKDGYCSRVKYNCFPPMPPLCVSGYFSNERQAYNTGFATGREAYP